MAAPEYVFDTEPIIAFLYNEPGHQDVANRLTAIEAGDAAGSLAEVNASEVFYLVARIEGQDEEPTAESLRDADRDIRALERRGLERQRTSWRLVGEIKAYGNIALGDAHAVALAAERDATLVVGPDDEFDELPVEVDIERFRDVSV